MLIYETSRIHQPIVGAVTLLRDDDHISFGKREVASLNVEWESFNVSRQHDQSRIPGRLGSQRGQSHAQHLREVVMALPAPVSER